MKALWIGNSHTYFYDMPYLTSLLYEAGTGEHMDVVMLAHPGMEWKWHMEQFYEIRFNLLYGQYDVCFLQQAAHPFPGEETTKANGKKLVDLCREVGTKPVITVTWAEEKKPYNQQIMNYVYEQFAREEQVALSLVGLAWEQVRAAYPDIQLYYQDGEHASSYGAYLNACCHYCALTGKSCMGLPNIGIDFLEPQIAGEKKQVKKDSTALQVQLSEKQCAQIQEIVSKLYGF